MNHNGNNIEARLWDAADELRANSKLKSSEYSVPVSGLVFLRFSDHKFQVASKELTSTSRSDWKSRTRSWKIQELGSLEQKEAGLNKDNVPLFGERVGVR